MTTAVSKSELRDRARRWSERLRAQPSVIRVQRLRQKWGSCSRRGVITLAADLAREPAAFQDFVIVHELLHLKIRNHGRVFKALMSAHVPSWHRLEMPTCRFEDE